jgi:hypothetical protein
MRRLQGQLCTRFHGRDRASAGLWLGARRSRYVDIDKTRNDARGLPRPVPYGFLKPVQSGPKF